MKIEIVLHKRRRGLNYVEVFEHMGENRSCVTKLVTSGNTPQHHAFAKNVIAAVVKCNIECSIDGNF